MASLISRFVSTIFPYLKRQEKKVAANIRTLDESIDFITPSDTAKCLHEAGHAYVCLYLGVVPNFMELIDDPASIGAARINVLIPSAELRRLVACGALAVEINLHEAGRLVDASGSSISETQFLETALGQNAAMDKIKFFGGDFEQANKCWPTHMDMKFLEASAALAQKISMPCVFDIATALLNDRHVSGDRLIEIASPYMPDNVGLWKK